MQLTLSNLKIYFANQDETSLNRDLRVLQISDEKLKEFKAWVLMILNISSLTLTEFPFLLCMRLSCVFSPERFYFPPKVNVEIVCMRWWWVPQNRKSRSLHHQRRKRVSFCIERGEEPESVSQKGEKNKLCTQKKKLNLRKSTKKCWRRRKIDQSTFFGFKSFGQ